MICSNVSLFKTVYNSQNISKINSLGSQKSLTISNSNFRGLNRLQNSKRQLTIKRNEEGFLSELHDFLLKYKELYHGTNRTETSNTGLKLANETLLSLKTKDVLGLIDVYEKAVEMVKAHRELLEDPMCDQEFRLEIEAELEENRVKLIDVESEIISKLTPEDRDDNRNAILELRPGAGGLEAGLFAKEILKMYKNYSVQNDWMFEILTITENECDGLRESTILVKGRGAFGRLKYETGVHRVQRVPETETLGRVHTSTMTVAVLPEVDDFEVQIKPQDIRIDTKRASGAGGQHVNTTESAVRIVHFATGITVNIQDERSQHQNKEKALKILKARIYEYEKLKLAKERDEKRRSQIGTGDRSERIRTYNFPQDRITDHRINKSLHGIAEMFEGEYLDDFIDEMNLKDRNERVEQILKHN